LSGRWLASLVLFACSQTALAALSAEAFTKEYVSLLRAALPSHTIEIVKPLEVLVSDSGGARSRAFLDNAYSQYLADPDARQEVLERHVASIAESARDVAPLSPKNIVPIVKDRAWLEETRATTSAMSGGKPAERVVDELNDVLVIVYAEDTPLNIRYFDAEALAKAGVERGGLRALAVANLRRLLPDIERHRGELFTMITAGGTYEASLLLLDDLWSGDALGVDGEPVVAVPARDLLLVTGSRNRAGIAQLRKIASEVRAEGTYTLTDELFVYRRGAFVRYTDRQ
jgi:uncharacterized protein YtpQ (UPF0354 family)